MTPAGEAEPRERRVLVLAPTGRDAALVAEVLERAGIATLACADVAELCAEIAAGAGAVIVGEEALTLEAAACLRAALASQPPWSDLPVILFTLAADAADAQRALEPHGSVTVLERPVRLSTMISTVRSALRARRRQLEVRDLLERQAETDRRKDEFLAMLGHELRNPLAAIRNAAALLDQVAATTPVAELPRQVIDRQVHHLARMIEDLLEVSRVTLGKITLQRRAVPLAEIVDRCLHELGFLDKARGRGLHLTFEAEPVLVDGDPVRLEQVVSNLLQNAVKYTPERGRIVVELRREDDAAVLRVRDDGIGIPPEMLATIFEPFTQVERSLARSQGGLGLGLPLVKRLVELHGGQVVARSAGPGQGSEFEVRLPLAAAADRDAPPAAAPATGRAGGEGLRILVVEDNVDGGDSLVTLLRTWGHRVAVARDGPEGLARLLADGPDVALVDIGLPGFDGNELARRARGAGAQGPRLVAMTGFGQPDDRRAALAAGFDHYLVKPVEPDDLRRVLRAARTARQPPLPADLASGRPPAS